MKASWTDIDSVVVRFLIQSWQKQVRNLGVRCDDVSNSAMTKPSWKIFYLIAAAFRIQPWWMWLVEPSVLLWRPVQSNHNEVKVLIYPIAKLSRKVLESAAMKYRTWPWWSRVKKSCTWPRQGLWFSHDECESDGCRFGYSEAFDSTLSKSSPKFF